MVGLECTVFDVDVDLLVEAVEFDDGEFVAFGVFVSPDLERWGDDPHTALDAVDVRSTGACELRSAQGEERHADGTDSNDPAFWRQPP